MKALLLIFSFLLILLLAGLWIGNGSYPDRWRIEKEIATQKAANELQKEKNRKIQAELDDLASGSDAIEERARSELGMTKKGETFYEVVLQPEPAETNGDKNKDVTGKNSKAAEKEQKNTKVIRLSGENPSNQADNESSESTSESTSHADADKQAIKNTQ